MFFSRSRRGFHVPRDLFALLPQVVLDLDHIRDSILRHSGGGVRDDRCFPPISVRVSLVVVFIDLHFFLLFPDDDSDEGHRIGGLPLHVDPDQRIQILGIASDDLRLLLRVGVHSRKEEKHHTGNNGEFHAPTRSHALPTVQVPPLRLISIFPWVHFALMRCGLMMEGVVLTGS
jgi:hypothetical protein